MKLFLKILFFNMVIWKKYYNSNLKQKSKKKKLNENSNTLLSFSVNNNMFLYFLNVKFYFRDFFSKNFASSKSYLQTFFHIISVLENIKLYFYQSCFVLFLNDFFLYQNYFVYYIIYFNFSRSNTNLQIVDSIGNSKIFYSSGLLNLTGKQKISRRLVLVKLFNLLTLLKLKFIKNLPIALHLKNVGSYKSLILQKLKKKFFIQIIKTYELPAYNGCRKKKERRKR